MAGKIAMTPLMRQFWIYGALPLLCLYGLNLFLLLARIDLVNSSTCVFPERCDPMYRYEQQVDFILPYHRAVFFLFFGLTAFNAYRVFRLSRNEANGKTKYGVRLAVFLGPLFAIILFPPLAFLVM